MGYPKCKGSHPSLQDHKTPEPHPVCTQKMKDTRRKGHQAFDQLWDPTLVTSPKMTRSEAYSWLRKVMKKTEAEAHFKIFTENEVFEALQLLKRDHGIGLEGTPHIPKRTVVFVLEKRTREDD
eukprot:PhF_6_TR27520/c0_g1_i1/m.40391